MTTDIMREDELDIVELWQDLLLMNFERKDCQDHAKEILQQLAYEFSVGNASLIPDYDNLD